MKSVEILRFKKSKSLKFLENLKGRNYLEELAVNGKTELNYILKVGSLRMWMGLIWLRIWTSRMLLYTL